MPQSVSPFVRALAEADFSQVAGKFADAGFTVRVPERGVLQIASPSTPRPRTSLLLSVGIHGDETAPIEMLAQLLESLASAPHKLTPDLMVVVGNPDAIAQEKRYVDADLNRMFRPGNGGLAFAAEAARAEAIMRETAVFFAADGTNKWHLDLHTAIRPSRYPAFAVVPGAVTEAPARSLLGWLGRAGIGAAILSTQSAGTYSAWTAEQFGATSATVELGRIGVIGGNDLDRFGEARDALDDFLRTGVASPGEHLPKAFLFAQELVKHSGAFRMTFDRNTQNFTAMQPGEIIAEDGDIVYRVGPRTEYVVFPNPDVRIGLRAGLMVVAAEPG